MKRICTKGQKKKALVESKHEPDLFKISELYPLPEKATDDSIMLQCTLQGGPRARMPVYTCLPLAQECLTAASTIQASPFNGAQLVHSAPDPIADIGGPLSQVQGVTVLKAGQPMTTMPVPVSPMFVLQHPMLQLFNTIPQPADSGSCASLSQFAAGFAAAMAQGQYFSTMLQSNMQAFNSAAYAP
jgi:hypothetical protein